MVYRSNGKHDKLLMVCKLPKVLTRTCKRLTPLTLQAGKQFFATKVIKMSTSSEEDELILITNERPVESVQENEGVHEILTLKGEVQYCHFYFLN